MRRVKRTAISLKPKQPYVDWANGLDEDGVKIGTEFTPEENIYLIADSTDQQVDLETLLEPYYQAIFEEELRAWHRIEADWPRRRDLKMFLAWFEVEVHSLVLDLVGGWIRSERYDRY
jgi:hypothetical protein